MPSPLILRTTVVVVLLGTGSTGCGTPPEVRQRSSAPLPAAPAPTASGSRSPGGTPALPDPTRSPTRPDPTGFDPGLTVDCRGEPGPSQVINLLRGGAGLLSAGVRATVTAGPLCAGTWQYTIVTVPGREPLQVISNGPAADLNLITAGTDVCNIPVRTIAPPGIRALACDGVPPPTDPPGGTGL